MLVSEDSKRYRLWTPKQPLNISRLARTVSLADMLSWPKPSTEARLKLGVKLASSVMQLHETEWLNERWRKCDIFFIQEEVNPRQRPVLEYPFLHREFTTFAAEAIPQAQTSFIVRCNKSLFSLGIVLIELCFWQSLESLRATHGQQADIGTTETVDYIIACRLIDSRAVHEEAGSKYDDAVRRCIIGLDHRETQLDNDDFKNEVYHRVVKLLEENLQMFYNG